MVTVELKRYIYSSPNVFNSVFDTYTVFVFIFDNVLYPKIVLSPAASILESRSVLNSLEVFACGFYVCSCHQNNFSVKQRLNARSLFTVRMSTD